MVFWSLLAKQNKKKKWGDRCGPRNLQLVEGCCFSISTSQRGRHSPSVCFTSKRAVAEAVTMMNAVKTAPGSGARRLTFAAEETRRRSLNLGPAAQTCACSALCRPRPELTLSPQHSPPRRLC